MKNRQIWLRSRPNGIPQAADFDLREVGLLYYVLASSETLIDALQRGARYCALVNEGISQACIGDKSVGISFHYVGVSRHLDDHRPVGGCRHRLQRATW